jgi:hypothetical protein
LRIKLWRDTQRQLNEPAIRMSELTLKIADTNDTITRFAEESRAADRQLGERIDALVSATLAQSQFFTFGQSC